jgi:hypothetical protein
MLEDELPCKLSPASSLSIHPVSLPSSLPFAPALWVVAPSAHVHFILGRIVGRRRERPERKTAWIRQCGGENTGEA